MSLSRQPQLRLESLDDRLVPSTTVLDLTTSGAVATAPNGAIVEQVTPSSTEASQITPFVRMSEKDGGSVQGYNTDARPLQFDDEKSNKKDTHSISLGQVPVVTVGGQTYLEFFLGVNQRNSSRDVSLDEVQIFLGSSKDLRDYNSYKNTLDGLSPVFDLDSGGNVTVKLDAELSSGKGHWNTALLVPEGDFAGASSKSFVYLYSKLDEQDCGRGRGGYVQWGIGPVQSAPTGGSISGSVLVAGSTVAIPGITIELQGTDSQGNAVNLTTTTDSNGNFSFTGLAAGTYSIIQEVPLGNLVITETVGTVNGVSNGTANQTNDEFTNIVLGAGQTGTGYVFGDSPAGG
jgi:hypothetical protein